MRTVRRPLRLALGSVLVAATVTGTVAAGLAGSASADGRRVTAAPGSDVSARLAETAKDRGLDALPPMQTGTTTAFVDGVQVLAFDAALVADVNAARQQAGVAPLTVAAGTEDLARTWSVQLAQGGVLKHNPDYVNQMPSYGSPGWGVVAENVGYAGDEKQLFNAYMESEHHRDNILNASVRFVGIATKVDASGRAWNTMDFTDSYSASYGPSRTAA